MTSYSVRSLFAGAAFAAAVLSGCGLDPRGGYRPLERSGSAETISFDEANARCWEQSMGLLGGLAMDAPRLRAYDTCMRRSGWEDPRLRPQPLPLPQTTPESSGR